MKKHVYPLCLIVLSLVAWLLVWDKLPASLPIHWGWNGVVDKTSNVAGSFFLTNGLLIGVYLLMIILPKIDPKKNNYPSFAKTYHLVLDSIITLFFVISVGTIALGLGMDLDMASLIAGFLGILFIILGFSMPKIEQNYFVGIRTPWTLCNKIVWKKTHKFGSKMYALSGVLTILTVAFLPKIALLVMIVSVIIASIISVMYSCIMFLNLNTKE